MEIKKVRSHYEIWENGQAVYEYKTKAAAETWATLRESDRQMCREIYAKRMAAKATGIPMRGATQRRFAYGELARQSTR